MGGPQNSMSQAIPGVGPGVGGGGGGHQHYDIERRPPKSAELFDPNGPQPSSNGGGGGQGDYGNSGRHQGMSDGGYASGQEGAMMGSERQPSQGHRGSFHGQYQSPLGPHYNQSTTQPTHVPIAMNRSYSSSSSSTGYSGGNTSSPGPHAGGKKNHNLLYDYSVPTTAYDGNAKSTATSEADKAPALGHILEIFAYDAQDDIFEGLALPAGSKMRRLKAANKEVLGQVLVVFKNASLASEALSAFQEGKSTWMSPDAKLSFKSSLSLSSSSASSSGVTEGSESTAGEQGESGDDVEEDDGEATPSTRLQRRFNVKIWTPVLVNSVTPLKATPQSQLSASPSNDSTGHSASSSSYGAPRSENGEEKDQEDGGAVAAASSCSSPTTTAAAVAVAVAPSSSPTPTPLPKGGDSVVDESS